MSFGPSRVLFTSRSWTPTVSRTRMPPLLVILGSLIGSRLLVFVAGAVGQLAGSRRAGWTGVDPGHVSSHLGALGNVLGATAVRWNALDYLRIAAHGYDRASATVFFPLYPLLIHVLAWPLRSEVAAGMVISTVSFWVALSLLYRLTEIEIGHRAATAAVALLAFSPLSFYFSAVYSESLLLALLLGAVYSACSERMELAGVLAGLAALTQVTGVVVVVAIVIIRRRQTGFWLERRLAWLLLAPAAFAGFCVYLSRRGYDLLAPLRNQAHFHMRHIVGPVATIGSGVRAGVDGLVHTVQGVSPWQPTLSGPFSHDFQSLILLCGLLIAVAALVGAGRRLPPAYGVYAGVLLLVVLSTRVTGQPLQAFGRFTLTMFVLWMGAGAWLWERQLLRPAVVLGACALAFCAFEFATWAAIG